MLFAMIFQIAHQNKHMVDYIYIDEREFIHHGKE